MKITNKNLQGFIIKIIGALVIAWSLSGCSADDVEGFFDLTPSLRTPPNDISAVPIYSSDGGAADDESKTEETVIPEEAENAPTDEAALYKTPDISSFTNYSNMWVKKYTGEYEKNEKTAYLTFDDGPSENTEAILKILKDNNVKATFFVVPDNGETCARRLRAVVEEGHVIGVHSYTHNYLTVYADENAFIDDFARAYDIIVNATNKKPWLYRFPGGSVNQYNRGCRDKIKEALDKRGFEYYDWNVDSDDWRGLSAEKLCENVAADASRFNNPVILMHDTDTRDNTVAALDKIIKDLKDQGYKFAPLTQQTEPIQYGVNW